MTARSLSPEAREALIVEALSDAIVAEVRRLLAEQAPGSAPAGVGAVASSPAANDTRPAPAVASRR